MLRTNRLRAEAQRWGILRNLADLSGNIFAPSRLRDANMGSHEAHVEFRRQSNQRDSIIATAASRYMAKRSVFRRNGTDASSKQDA
jgi:hypothetical protein